MKESSPATKALMLTAYDDEYILALMEAVRSVSRGEPVLHPAIAGIPPFSYTTLKVKAYSEIL